MTNLTNDQVINDHIRKNIISKIRVAFLNFYSEKGFSLRKIENMFNELEKKPTKINELTMHLKRYPEFTIDIEGDKILTHRFEDYYENSIQNSLLKEYKLPQFPLSKLRYLKGELEVKNFADKYLSKIFKIKEIEIDLIKLFRFG